MVLLVMYKCPLRSRLASSVTVGVLYMGFLHAVIEVTSISNSSEDVAPRLQYIRTNFVVPFVKDLLIRSDMTAPVACAAAA